MTAMVNLKKFRISEMAAKLQQPFSLADVTFVGDILVSLYLCQGTLEWHKHTDIDEMFWVYEGTILVESEVGNVHLHPGELTIVPQGVIHRSSSARRANVLLLRCGIDPERKNGRRRLYAVNDNEGLEHVSLQDTARAAHLPFQFHTAAQIEGASVQVAWGEGTWPVEIPTAQDLLFFVLKGTATARTTVSMLHLHAGDLTVIPEGSVYQISTTKDTTLVQIAKEKEDEK
jgi:mannose-6-phosphate isomerase-like protein (cupin superfamily)